ncbi:hypothetical protein PQG02_03350 [Nostoc sp. UHCC 0926]|uniref:hypothetical protein n=1 Tax=unclassified Nostoc TaxID=2593658 RepID=UPI00235DCEF9|nr:hypothetical protein [Nostoc sp. UHCC 0926]WDD33442.1 hypothetical protein PQG02_03350 [Nostoc sp. UHCC 0926]
MNQGSKTLRLWTLGLTAQEIVKKGAFGSPSFLRLPCTHKSENLIHIGLNLVGCVMDISPNTLKIWDGALPSGITLISDRFPTLG